MQIQQKRQATLPVQSMHPIIARRIRRLTLPSRMDEGGDEDGAGVEGAEEEA